MPELHGIIIIKNQLELFQARYKSSLIESFKAEAHELEKQIAQKWCKVIKNALLAKRLKQDSSINTIISNESFPLKSEDGIRNTACISSLALSSCSSGTSKEFEIEEFENI